MWTKGMIMVITGSLGLIITITIGIISLIKSIKNKDINIKKDILNE